jgi:Lon protease-like protein
MIRVWRGGPGQEVEEALMLAAEGSPARVGLGERIATERQRGSSGFSLFAAGLLASFPADELQALLELPSAQQRCDRLVALLSDVPSPP